MSGQRGGFAEYLFRRRAQSEHDANTIEICEEHTDMTVNICPHRGTELRDEECPSCKGHVRVKVFQCSKHLECTMAKAINGIHVCDHHKTILWNDPLTDVMTPDEARAYIGPPAKRSKEWQHHHQTKRAMRGLLDEAVATQHISPLFEGRGIVASGGGHKYFPLAYAMVYTLRQLGCVLPVELWHIGPAEMTLEMRNAIERLGVTVRDCLSVGSARLLGGWESKLHSIKHSRFAEVLYIDADNLPAIDPTCLFEDSEYRRTGAMFWPDLPNGRVWIPNETWDVAGIPVDRRARPAFESGQVLINKSQRWHELEVAVHLNDYSDCWYEFVYGDKDTFKLAWHRCGTDYAMPPRSKWINPVIHQHDMNGRVAFYHACQGKPQIEGGGPVPGIPNEHNASIAAARRDLRQVWSGIAPGTSRSDFENICRSRAVDIVMGDGSVLTRCIGRFLIYCDPVDQAMTPWFRSCGFWESWITLATAKIVQPGWKCVNVGANYGYYSLLLAALTGEEVHAFEPIARTASLLRRTVSENGLPVTVHQYAAYSSAGAQQMSFDPSNLGGAGIGDWQREKETVECVRLDDVIESADLIFIDAEGAEAEVMQGAERLIANGARVVVEVDQARAYPVGWVESLAKRWPLRWLNYDGNVEPIASLSELVNLYLGP